MPNYTVVKIAGVTIIYSDSAISISDYSTIIEDRGWMAVMDTALANRLGAVLAFGSPKDLEKFKATRPAPSKEVEEDLQAAKEMLSGKALREVLSYLDGYDRSRSADALLQSATGIYCTSTPTAFPSTNEDMARCVWLYKSCVAVRKGFKAVAGLSDEWREVSLSWKTHVAKHSKKNDQT